MTTEPTTVGLLQSARRVSRGGRSRLDIAHGRKADVKYGCREHSRGRAVLAVLCRQKEKIGAKG